jgi:hypothetical protein
MLKGDEGYGSGGDGGLNTLMSFSMNDNNFGLTADTWSNMYQGIYRANQVIANVPGIQMDPNLRTRIVAEAKFLRGLFYFNLTLYFGRPVLVLEPSTTALQPPNATPVQRLLQIYLQRMEVLIWGEPQKGRPLQCLEKRICNKKNISRPWMLLHGWLQGRVQAYII